VEYLETWQGTVLVMNVIITFTKKPHKEIHPVNSESNPPHLNHETITGNTTPSISSPCLLFPLTNTLQLPNKVRLYLPSVIAVLRSFTAYIQLH
jgi:hypothetical protein